jgi:hypothetical protein
MVVEGWRKEGERRGKGERRKEEGGTVVLIRRVNKSHSLDPNNNKP